MDRKNFRTAARGKTSLEAFYIAKAIAGADADNHGIATKESVQEMPPPSGVDGYSWVRIIEAAAWSDYDIGTSRSILSEHLGNEGLDALLKVLNDAQGPAVCVRTKDAPLPEYVFIGVAA